MHISDRDFTIDCDRVDKIVFLIKENVFTKKGETSAHFLNIDYLHFSATSNHGLCSPSPCVHGRCFHNDVTFFCVCDTGFTGKVCEIGNVSLIDFRSL